MDKYQGKKILVAGGSGLVGLSMTKRLLALGAEVKSTYFSNQPKEFGKYFEKRDFTNYTDCIEATKEKEYVIIAAAQASGVAGAKANPTSPILPNLQMYASLFEACAMNAVKKVIFVSSSSVYQPVFYPLHESDLDLNLPTFSLYQGMGGMFRYIEQLAKCYFEKHNLQIGVLRTSSVYGPNDQFSDEKSHVIPALIKRALKKENPFVVWGSPGTVRDFVYVDDLVESILEVLERSCNADPINVCHGQPTTIAQAVETILKVCEHSVEPVYDLNKPSAVPYRALSMDKYHSLFGVPKRTSFEQGIRTTTEWYKQISRI